MSCSLLPHKGDNQETSSLLPVLNGKQLTRFLGLMHGEKPCIKKCSKPHHIVKTANVCDSGTPVLRGRGKSLSLAQVLGRSDRQSPTVLPAGQERSPMAPHYLQLSRGTSSLWPVTALRPVLLKPALAKGFTLRPCGELA